MTLGWRGAGAWPVVLALMVGSASVVAGHPFWWTGSQTGDGLLTILGAGAFGLAIALATRLGSNQAARIPFAGLDALIDASLVWFAYYAAYRLRFGNGEALRVNFPSFLLSYPPVVACQMLALMLAGAYGRVWRPMASGATAAFAVAVTAIQLLLQFAIIGFWNETRAYSRGVFLLGGAGTFLLLVGWRLAAASAAAAPAWWRSAGARARGAISLAVACALTGGAWAVVVPPFEAPDEIYFCRIAVDVAESGRSPAYDPMFFRLVEPLLHVTFNAGLRFDAVRNSAFRFVSNQPGRVTMFRHGPGSGIGRRELAALYLMRGVVLALAIATTLLIYLSSLAFFGRADLALLVAGLCFLVPQFSFAGSQVNPESLSTLWGAAAAALVIGRATRALSPRVAWALLIPLLGTAPFTDSAAWFLVPFAPLALAVVEHGWKRRLTLLMGVIAFGISVVWMGHTFAAELPQGVPVKLRTLLEGADLRALSNLAHPIAPFLRQADTPRYLAYEFTPKMFFGFWGWLGQPSILLPAWFYAGVFVLLVASVIGLTLRGYPRVRSSTGVLANTEPLAFLVVAGFGLVAMLIPIVYSTVLWNRDEWYGRWLFPWLGPIMILITVGIRECWRLAVRRPHVLSAVLAIVFVVVGGAWLDGIGDRITSGVRANHYGDQDHLLRTVRYAVFGLGLLPVAIELIAFVGNRHQVVSTSVRRDRVRRGAPAVVLCSACMINLGLLFAFVRPLYRPLDGPGYAKVIRAELAQRDLTRAAAIADEALREFPDSTDLSRVALEVMANTGQYDALATYVRSRVATSAGVLTPEEALGLARAIRASSGTNKETFLSVARTRPPMAGAEAHQILALELLPESAMGARTIPPAATGRAKLIGLARRGVRLESFSTRSLPDGDREVIVYFRPLVEWGSRRLWFHAYPAGSQVYVNVDAVPPAFESWRTGELAWEVFRTPGPGRFNVYIGIRLDGDLGDAHPLGQI